MRATIFAMPRTRSTSTTADAGALIAARFPNARPRDVHVDEVLGTVSVRGEVLGADPRDANIVGGLLAAALGAVEDTRR